jgi:hypothetical protein
MVLVDPQHRKLGIATRLMKVALEFLLKAGIATVKLDATAAGRSLYENLGFREEGLIERWVGIASPRPVACESLNRTSLKEALVFDRNVLGADRSELINMLVADCLVTPIVARGIVGEVTGYALARQGSAAVYVGPLLAEGTSAATTLLDGLLSQVSGQNVYIDLNTNFEGGRKILHERGFVKQRDLIRMSYGQESSAASSPSIFAIAGPEVG